MQTEIQKQRYIEWSELVEKQEKIGLSQKDFCKQHELVLSKFFYYRSLSKAQIRRTQINSATLAQMQMQLSSRSLKHANQITSTHINIYARCLIVLGNA